MKLQILVAGICLILANLANAGQSKKILNTKSLAELLAVAEAEKIEVLRRRACEIQSHEGTIPTFCYSAAKAKWSEIDLKCVQLAARADRLPKIGQWTSPACRAAVESRARDLAYVAGGNALR